MQTDPVQGTVWLFNQLLGTFSLDSTVPWSVCSLPIPQAYQVAHGFVYMQVEGWCPADSGVNTDPRTLGVRLRRIWVE